MIDVVYVLGKGSQWEDRELRYSLRSIDKWLTNYRNVYIVGEKPEWLQNIIHIPASDDDLCKETNIMKKIVLACLDKDISEKFLFINDDHFLLSPFEADSFPFYYKGLIEEEFNRRKVNDTYKRAMYNTIHALREKHLHTKNFDTHTPIIYNKHLFVQIMNQFNWGERYGFTIKSLYANRLHIIGEPEPDCKISRKMTAWEIIKTIAPRKVFSMGNYAICDDLKNVLDGLYPNKSKYEK